MELALVQLAAVGGRQRARQRCRVCRDAQLLGQAAHSALAHGHSVGRGCRAQRTVGQATAGGRTSRLPGRRMLQQDDLPRPTCR